MRIKLPSLGPLASDIRSVIGRLSAILFERLAPRPLFGRPQGVRGRVLRSRIITSSMSG
jgi:hypothetical protein